MAILKKRLGLDLRLYTILQILNLTLFEKTSISQMLTNIPPEVLDSESAIQLHLFTLCWDSRVQIPVLLPQTSDSTVELFPTCQCPRKAVQSQIGLGRSKSDSTPGSATESPYLRLAWTDWDTLTIV